MGVSTAQALDVNFDQQQRQPAEAESITAAQQARDPGQQEEGDVSGDDAGDKMVLALELEDDVDQEKETSNHDDAEEDQNHSPIGVVVGEEPVDAAAAAHYGASNISVHVLDLTALASESIHQQGGSGEDDAGEIQQPEALEEEIADIDDAEQPQHAYGALPPPPQHAATSRSPSSAQGSVRFEEMDADQQDGDASPAPRKKKSHSTSDKTTPEPDKARGEEEDIEDIGGFTFIATTHDEPVPILIPKITHHHQPTKAKPAPTDQ